MGWLTGCDPRITVPMGCISVCPRIQPFKYNTGGNVGTISIISGHTSEPALHLLWDGVEAWARVVGKWTRVQQTGEQQMMEMQTHPSNSREKSKNGSEVCKYVGVNVRFWRKQLLSSLGFSRTLDFERPCNLLLSVSPDNLSWAKTPEDNKERLPSGSRSHFQSVTWGHWPHLLQPPPLELFSGPTMQWERGH